MAGIYIHIPFCEKACHYCDFHFSTSLREKDRFLHCLHSEIDLKKNELKSNPIQSIYFGGGTPSLLDIRKIQNILIHLKSQVYFSKNIEITLEINPNHLSLEYVKNLIDIGVNRLSIGIQSFHNDHLKWMNRGHKANHSILCIENALKGGFKNFSIDLIYGFPNLTLKQWKKNITIFLSYNIPHLSAYCITVEPKTHLHYLVKKRKYKILSDEFIEQQYNYLVDTLQANGIEQYEISNYAKNNIISKHNVSYWQGEPYIGLGPSAHSFDGKKRKWNITNNRKYYESIEKEIIPEQFEILQPHEKYNEYILLGLRTKWGIQINFIKKKFGINFAEYFKNKLNSLKRPELIISTDDQFYLSKKGMLFADQITQHFFMI